MRCNAPGVEIDHIVPVALGGSNDITNLQLLCRACHAEKSRIDIRAIAKANRMRCRMCGSQLRKQPIGWKKWKRKINGRTVLR